MHCLHFTQVSSMKLQNNICIKFIIYFLYNIKNDLPNSITYLFMHLNGKNPLCTYTPQGHNLKSYFSPLLQDSSFKYSLSDAVDYKTNEL